MSNLSRTWLWVLRSSAVGEAGDPYIGRPMAIDAIRQHSQVTLLDPLEVDDKGIVMPTAIMGAPTIIVEKIARGDEILDAFALEEHLGRKSVSTASAEAGGLNSTVPLAVGARLGIPAVDCDGIGRAFPEILLVTFFLHGISSTPITMSDENGKLCPLGDRKQQRTEWIERSIIIVMAEAPLLLSTQRPEDR